VRTSQGQNIWGFSFPILSFFDCFAMGINCLLPFFKRLYLKNFAERFFRANRRSGCLLLASQGARRKLPMPRNVQRYLEVCTRYLDLLQDFEITPVLVFDGCPLPAKHDENERRRRTREERVKQAEELVEKGQKDEARRVMAQPAQITFDVIKGLIKVCRERGIEYIVSLYEADAQIAHPLQHQLADFAVSEDSDLLAYGCSKVLLKLKSNGDADLVEICKVLEHLQLHCICRCIAAGCDHLRNIRGIGIKRAKDIVSKSGFEERISL